MAASVVTERYSASAAAAWSLVGDFDGIDKVFDDVADVVIEGDTRTFSLMGMRISERLLSRDDASRSLTYSIVDGVAIEHHEATIHVEPEGGGCEVQWSVTAEPEAAQPLFADAYRRALEALHTRLDRA